jgi:hypothetical protein
MAKDVDAEGHIFDDPCLPCRLKNISCLVSPKSTRCATCVRGDHGCSATSSIQLSRTYGSLAAVHARINSAETDLGHSIDKSTEILASLQHSQSQIYNLQQELDILRRRRARMRLSEPSTSPRRAPSSPAFSDISSASDTDVCWLSATTPIGHSCDREFVLSGGNTCNCAY